MKRVILVIWMAVGGVGGMAARQGRAGEIDVIPRPAKVEMGTGEFVVDGNTRIAVDEKHRGMGTQLAGYLAPAMGFSLEVKGEDRAKNVIRIQIDPGMQAELGEEGYRLEVTGEAITIQGADEAGAFYGIQTLRQLLPVRIFWNAAAQAPPDREVKWSVPVVKIEDRPRFAWRGMMLDCSRHFFSKEFVERFLDLMAMHKFNRFHWHLTDDQGWRIQILKYPKLTEVGSWRKESTVGREAKTVAQDKFDGQRYGGFYTQDDVRDVVKYAANLHIIVVPEIEMPGHSTAAIAAYPELGCTDEPVEVGTHWGIFHTILNPLQHTMDFYQDVLTEVMGLFPGPYIHIGGDEVPLDEWKGNARIKAREEELGMKSDEEMEGYFVSHMAKFVSSQGRQVVGWDDILKAEVPAGSAIMSWHGIQPAIEAAREGDDTIMTPNKFTYFNYGQTHEDEGLTAGNYLPLKMVYGFDPVPKDLPAAETAHILGVQGQLWTFYYATPERAEYMIFPRACALAEGAWSPAEGKDFGDFEKRLGVHLKRLDEMGVGYREPKVGD